MPADNPTQDGSTASDQPDSGGPSIHVYQDARYEWRWRALGPDGDIEADSGEGFPTVEAALQSVARTRSVFANATLDIDAETGTAAPTLTDVPVADAGGDAR